MPSERRDRGESSRPRARGLFERFPEGLVLVGERRAVVSMNPRARELLGLLEDPAEPEARTCCELVCDRVAAERGDGPRCLTEPLLDAKGADGAAEGAHLPSIGGADPLSVTVSRLDAEDVRVLIQVAPAADAVAAKAGALGGRPELRIHTMGRVSVELAGRDVGGAWVAQRPGLLLKYLACERHRVAASDRIAEALWPEAERREALTNLRHYVHVLRERLEPGRGERGAPSFIETHRGGYRLDPERVWVDATELEQRAERGLELHGDGQAALAGPLLENAVRLHLGDFLPDDPDAEWALEERERLHGLVARACEALVEGSLAEGDLESAERHARALADLEPLDIEIQRQLIEIWLRQGRRSEAARRYEVLRTRTMREFGEEPGFSLADLAR